MPTDKYWDETNGIWQKIGVSPSDLTDLAGTERTTETVKGNADALTTHKADTVQHITASERSTWNAKVDNTNYLRSPGYAVTSGTSTVYAITLNPAPTAYTDGQQFVILPHVDCGASPTLNVNGLGAFTILNQDGSAISAGDIMSNKPLSLVRVGSNFFLRSGSSYVGVTFNNFIAGNRDILSKNITNLTPSVSKEHLSATTVGNYALFGGGFVNSNVTSAVVDAYDTSLTRSIPTALSQARTYLSATTVGNYALFGGGDISTSGGYTATVDAYNTSLTRTTPTALSVSKEHLSATTVGNYALFGGGDKGDDTPYATVDAYDTSLTRSTPTALSAGRSHLSATTVGNYALFGGGYYSGCSATVDAYDTSLTRSTPTALSVSRGWLSATTVGNYALFGGGGFSTPYATVDAYDTSLTRSTPTVLSQVKTDLAATTIGKNALFGGGGSTDIYQYTAYYSTATIPVTVGSKYNFGGVEQIASSTSIIATNPINGYIKYKKGIIS